MAEPAVTELQRDLGEDLELVWKAYELRPDPVPLPPPDWDYFKEIWKNSIYPLAERFGKKMTLPPVKPRSRLAHQAAKWAESEDVFVSVRDAMFNEYFENGKDIGKIDVICDIVSGLNLDADALENSLQKETFLEQVIGEEREASELGLTGVPAFVANRKNGLMGLQTPESLKKLVESVGE